MHTESLRQKDRVATHRIGGRAVVLPGFSETERPFSIHYGSHEWVVLGGMFNDS